MNLPSTPISAAEITVPSIVPIAVAVQQQPTVTITKLDALLADIQDMLDRLPAAGEPEAPTKNDRAIIAIQALIEGGVATGPGIIRAAVRLGFKREHAGAVLSKSRGPNPLRHLWRRGTDDEYRLLPA